MRARKAGWIANKPFFDAHFMKMGKNNDQMVDGSDWGKSWFLDQ